MEICLKYFFDDDAQYLLYFNQETMQNSTVDLLRKLAVALRYLIFDDGAVVNEKT